MRENIGMFIFFYRILYLTQKFESSENSSGCPNPVKICILPFESVIVSGVVLSILNDKLSV